MGKRKSQQPSVDWSKVPVVIIGTPNPAAIEAIVQSILEFELREQMQMQRAINDQQPNGPVIEHSHPISSTR